jgi:hypothetical protein
MLMLLIWLASLYVNAADTGPDLDRTGANCTATKQTTFAELPGAGDPNAQPSRTSHSPNREDRR